MVNFYSQICKYESELAPGDTAVCLPRPTSPSCQVGDYRVQFSYSGRQGEEYTIVGRQAGREVGHECFRAPWGRVVETAFLSIGLRGCL